MNAWWHWRRRRARERLEADRASIEPGAVAAIRGAIGEPVPLRQPLVRPARDRKAPTSALWLAEVSRRQMERHRRGM